MTVYGWDGSHYDEPPTVRDSIDFYTHKCAEGHHFYQDLEYKASLNNAKTLGIPVLGAYFVNHPGTVQDQVDWFINLVNTLTPWWREVNWIWQIDAEKFPYMQRAPSIEEINGFGDLIVNRTGSPSNSVFAYAPPWLYGTSLLNLKYPHWSSNYGPNPRVHYKEAYPGDASSRWTPFGGSKVVVLQYGSTTTIGNQTTCDANAYRGTVSQLINFISGGTMLQSEWNNLFLGMLKGSDAVSTEIRAMLRAIAWQYTGGGIPAGMSTLNVLNTTLQNTSVPTSPEDISALAAAIASKLPQGIVLKQDITDALTEVLQKAKFTVTP